MRKVRFGELSAVVTGGTDGQGGGTGPAVVLLHGFGAPGTDLVPLASELGLPKSVRFVFPMAPILLEVGVPEDYAGRAWWLIDIARLQSAVFSGQVEALTEHEPDGLAEARAKLEGLLDALPDALRVKPEQVLLGGFSQGAMLAADTVLTTERAFGGLVILSGMLIRSSLWAERAPSRRSLPVFQSHGTADPILPFAAAELLRDCLRNAGLSVDWLSFPGGHGIPPNALTRLAAFAQRAFGAQP